MICLALNCCIKYTPTLYLPTATCSCHSCEVPLTNLSGILESIETSSKLKWLLNSPWLHSHLCYHLFLEELHSGSKWKCLLCYAWPDAEGKPELKLIKKEWRISRIFPKRIFWRGGKEEMRAFYLFINFCLFYDIS